MIRRLLNITFNTFVVIVILVSGLYIASASQTLYDQTIVPSVFGFTPLTVVSGSMSPEIKTGDMVIVKNGNRNIKTGDVVTYRLEGMLITHRVKNISEENDIEVFITKGDANNREDYKAVERSQILGKCVFKIPMGGYIRASLRGLPGILIVFGLVAISLMLEVLSRTREELEKVKNTIM